MRIFDAYDDASVRILFKRYIEAEGVSLTRREQIYTRFGTYMSRIRGGVFYEMMRQPLDESEFRDKLSFIFFEKWKGYMGYPEIPDYFFRYLDFLHYLSAVDSSVVIDGLATEDESELASGNLSRFEQRFVSEEGKLRLLANPILIRRLKKRGVFSLPVSEEAIEICDNFYADSLLSMSSEDWKKLFEDVLTPKNKTSKRGSISYEIREAGGEPRICNSSQVMEIIISLAGKEKIACCNLRQNGQPIIVRRIPYGKDSSFKDLGDGYFLNIMGSAMDKFKVMKVLISLFRLPLEISLSQKIAKKSPGRRRGKKQAEIIDSKPTLNPTLDRVPIPTKQPAKQPPIHIAEATVPKDEDFIYGKDGTLNLFDDL
ncbi:MAG: hypothetical protein NC097_08020 [Clostridium sp.]|nr:hypothetical protein [Prevotella sp.]MCM1429722.1 hypothetical protein [Clostridium sp.]MCM1476195.1 hypothetical protein [Muribaculaceae bacterium]